MVHGIKSQTLQWFQNSVSFRQLESGFHVFFVLDTKTKNLSAFFLFQNAVTIAFPIPVKLLHPPCRWYSYIFFLINFHLTFSSLFTFTFFKGPSLRLGLKYSRALGFMAPFFSFIALNYSLQFRIWRYLITFCLPHMVLVLSFIWPGVISIFSTTEFYMLIIAPFHQSFNR